MVLPRGASKYWGHPTPLGIAGRGRPLLALPGVGTFGTTLTRAVLLCDVGEDVLGQENMSPEGIAMFSVGILNVRGRIDDEVVTGPAPTR
eukprot:9475732-Pyramimonas_sp.AAC.1